MPVSFNPQTSSNNDLIFQQRTNVLSLSVNKKQKEKNPSNQRSNVRLPSIGIMLDKYNKSRETSSDMKTTKPQTPLKISKEEKFNRMNAMKSKIQLKPNSKKVILNTRPKVLSIASNLNNKKTAKNREQLKSTSILEIPISSTKINANNSKTIGTQKFFELMETKQTYVKIPRFADTGVQTDNCEISKQAYDEFIKFRITERQKYEKLKNLFKYVENLTHLESQNIQANSKQFSTLIQSNDQTYRDKMVLNLLSQLDRKFFNFNQIFKDVFTTQRDNIKDFQRIHNDYHAANKKLMKDLEEKISNLCVQKEQSGILNFVQQIFHQTIHKHENFIRDSNQIFTQKMDVFYKNYKELQEKYFEWNKTTFDQSKLIKTCVMNILELPGLLIGLFGSSKVQENQQNNDQSKAYNSDNIANQIVDFFVKRRRPEPKQINDIFLKCCEVKCMTCVYIKTKMRFIHQKNRELKPIVKALMHLVDNNSIQSQFQKIATQRNLNYTTRKLN